MEFAEIMNVVCGTMDECRKSEIPQGNELAPEMWAGLGFEEAGEVAKELSKLQRTYYTQRVEREGIPPESQILMYCDVPEDETIGHLFEEMLDLFICIKRLFEVAKVDFDPKKLRQWVTEYEDYKMKRARSEPY